MSANCLFGARRRHDVIGIAGSQSRQAHPSDRFNERRAIIRGDVLFLE